MYSNMHLHMAILTNANSIYVYIIHVAYDTEYEHEPFYVSIECILTCIYIWLFEFLLCIKSVNLLEIQGRSRAHNRD